MCSYPEGDILFLFWTLYRRSIRIESNSTEKDPSCELHLSLSGFTILSFRYFSTIKRNTLVHWHFRERNQSLRDHRWEPFSTQYNPREKKKSRPLPQGILLFFELNHRCSQQDQIDNNIQWQNSNKNRFRFQHEQNDALRHQPHSDRWFILRHVLGYSHLVFEESDWVLLRSYADLPRAT